MSQQIHSGPSLAPLIPGQCSWRWHWESTYLRCDKNVIPGGALCADHLIELTDPQRTA